MKEMTCQRAEALRKLLRLTIGEIALGMNRLAGTNYTSSEAGRWFKTRPPSVTLALYLRSVLKARWHRRIALRAVGHDEAKESILGRTKDFIGIADSATLGRFEKRLRLSEFDLEAHQRRAEV